MQDIANFLEVSLKWRKINNYAQFNITTSSYKSNKLLIDYLTKYPLFTSKYLNYMDWVCGLNLFYNKSKNKATILKMIKIIKRGMNKKRKNLTWDHLINFY